MSDYFKIDYNQDGWPIVTMEGNDLSRKEILRLLNSKTQKIQELEKQLEEAQLRTAEIRVHYGDKNSDSCNMCNWLERDACVESKMELRKQLAESVPKSEIRKVVFKKQICVDDEWFVRVDNFKALLTPPAKENNS